MLTMYVRPSGLEPLTYSLEGCCSIRLSYGRISQQNVMNMFFRRADSPPLADQTATFPISSAHPISPDFKQLFNRFLNYSVGETGFEPATSWSQTKRSSRAELLPVRLEQK